MPVTDASLPVHQKSGTCRIIVMNIPGPLEGTECRSAQFMLPIIATLNYS